MGQANPRGSFTQATWNKPSRYIPPEYVSYPNPGKSNLSQMMCFRCRQFGHLARNCRNECYEEDSSPLCGNCKQQGHLLRDCKAPFNHNSTSSQPQMNRTQDQNQRMQESPVHLVEIVQAVETRGQKRNADPVLEQPTVKRAVEPERQSSESTNEKEARFTPKQIL